jgi:predicted GIY-YIG superfamily endonuclease
MNAEEFESRYEALEMERKLKGWSHAKKVAYMRGDWSAVRQLAKGRHKHQKA